MSQSPIEILARSRMGAMQFVAVAMCVALNALDGFDVLAISFAAPGIAEQWGIDRGALGVVLSMELIGMAVGSVLLGTIADRIGRRPTILSCLALMAGGMVGAALAHSVAELSAYRLLTGLGIGGMLAAINAMAAEYANQKNRSFAVTIMAAGYPLGAIAGGSITTVLLTHYPWQSVFVFGAAATAVFIPLVWFLLPESVEYLARRQPRGALERINRTLRRMGHETVETLAPIEQGTKKSAGMASLFAADLRVRTLVLTLAYFAHIMTFYFIIKWIPKIVVDMGYHPSEAAGVLVWANVGGASGAILLGLLSTRINVRWLVIGALAVGFALVAYFGQGQADLRELALVAACAGFFTNAAIVGFYALMALAFPTDVRAGGTGFVIGVGRGGAALGPIVAGYLFVAGAGLDLVAMVMASGSVVAAISLVALRLRTAQS
ncbi:MAG: MFS transporter [Hydrogenophilaceae bacterium]|jgi:benzoate transport|nr:MFS transporter [Hydrogenophilaceae bacterium]